MKLTAALLISLISACSPALVRVDLGSGYGRPKEAKVQPLSPGEAKEKKLSADAQAAQWLEEQNNQILNNKTSWPK